MACTYRAIDQLSDVPLPVTRKWYFNQVKLLEPHSPLCRWIVNWKLLDAESELLNNGAFLRGKTPKFLGLHRRFGQIVASYFQVLLESGMPIVGINEGDTLVVAPPFVAESGLDLIRDLSQRLYFWRKESCGLFDTLGPVRL